MINETDKFIKDLFDKANNSTMPEFNIYLLLLILLILSIKSSS